MQRAVPIHEIGRSDAEQSTRPLPFRGEPGGDILAGCGPRPRKARSAGCLQFRQGGVVRVVGLHDFFVVGRGESCNLRVLSSTVSRRHFAVVCEGDDVTVRDLASRNGTFVNGRRVYRSSPLKPGDRITACNHEFVWTHEVELRLDLAPSAIAS